MVSLRWAPMLALLAWTPPFTLGTPIDPNSQSDNPAQILRRALPMFKNFPPGSPKKGALEQAFKDLPVVVNGVLKSDGATYDTIFAKYFKPQHRDAVKQVFQNMVSPADHDASTGADIFATIQIDADDYLSTKPCDKTAVAYTNNWVTQPTQMHFCDSNVRNAYAFPDLSEITCDKLGPTVSDKMLSLGGYALLHEVSHFNKVSQGPITPFNQPQNEVGDYGYGPQKTRQLLQEPSDRVVANADSYAWFANEVYWSNKCGHGFGAPTDNSFTPPGVCTDPNKDNCLLM
ncbi:MAG: hypothetical protein M4579_002046 [Chaenotheca gracillima]|nr:MAG: hypothetical protein M4579_002046 [Chaenotheca gracillima]